MKTFNNLLNEYFDIEDDMSISELNIAINSAKIILNSLDDGAELERWQISAIVKAAHELSSVANHISIENEDNEDDNPFFAAFTANEETEMNENKTLLGPVGAIHKAASMNQSDREYIIQKAFKNKWKSENPNKTWPGYEKAGFTGFKYQAEETEMNEGYNDPIHRNYISDIVHEYFPKTDPKHDIIVDHLHKAKNFGTKTIDNLETIAGISTGAAMRITKSVAEHLKNNFGTAQKTQTQTDRIKRYLSQKTIGPRSK